MAIPELLRLKETDKGWSGGSERQIAFMMIEPVKADTVRNLNRIADVDRDDDDAGL